MHTPPPPRPAGDGSLPDECCSHPRVLRKALCHQQSIHGQRAVPAAAKHNTEQQSTADPSREEASLQEGKGLVQLKKTTQ